MGRADPEMFEGLRLAAVAIACAFVTAGLVIGAGEFLLRGRADAASMGDSAPRMRPSR